MNTSTRLVRTLALLAVGGALLGACSSATATGGSTAAATSGRTVPGAGGTGGGNGFRQPGVSGLVAEIDGSTMQVQGSSTQTAVTWTGKTTVTKVVPATAAAVKVGACVTVREATSSSTTSSPATPLSGPVVASSIAVSAATNGQCGASGARPAGAPTGAPSGFPTGPGGGGAGGAPTGLGPRGGFGVMGRVSAVAGSTVTVERTRVPSASGTSQAADTVGIQTSAATTYTTTAAGTAHDFAVGKCVTAIGQADATGAVAATVVSVRNAVDGQCQTVGFGARPNGSGGSSG